MKVNVMPLCDKGPDGPHDDEISGRPLIAFDDEDLYPLADAMLAKHGMLLRGPITHHPTTHGVNFTVEQVGEPGINVRVTLPIDMFTDEMRAANTWLRALERGALRGFRGAKPE